MSRNVYLLTYVIVDVIISHDFLWQISLNYCGRKTSALVQHKE